MIYGWVENAEAVVAHVDAMPGKMRAALQRAVREAAMKLLTHVKQDKLSGQVLNVRTGNLRRSINQRVDVSGDSVIGTVGTNSVYGAFHEYGFHGVENVREHMRRRAGQMKGAGKAKKGEGDILVRAHERHVDYDGRSFLRSALDDMAADIAGRIETAVKESIK